MDIFSGLAEYGSPWTGILVRLQEGTEGRVNPPCQHKPLAFGLTDFPLTHCFSVPKVMDFVSLTAVSNFFF